eukprot:CAMPEP_0184859890 /NCGR_PEP_ID=MMETSP0580-20130426/4854_1 /TAXON_ID=1118495 /ORGANISM="Dactyliosolen fragilissimus" /LENGTH=794 /DNA_ID=CAMNT_0027356755 /DNA_START=218 /DNA_END=2602 /DNA_ORIENTATION=-
MPMRIPDSGRGLQMGQLYDARSESGVNGAFVWFDPSSQVEKRTSPYVNVEFENEMSFSTRTNLFQISASASVDYLVTKYGGSVDFIDEKVDTSKSLRMVVHYTSRSHVEKIDVFDVRLEDRENGFDFGSEGDQESTQCAYSVSQDDVCIPATHFVSSVTYGSDVYITFESIYEYNLDRDKLKIALQAKIIGIRVPDIPLPGGYDDIASSLNERTTVRVHGDLSTTDRPATLEEAIEFIRNLPTTASIIPVDITLTPLSFLDHDPSNIALPATTLNKIGDDTQISISKLIDDLDHAETILKDLLKLTHKGFPSWKVKVDLIQSNFQYYKRTIVPKLKKNIELAKSDLSSNDGFENDNDNDTIQGLLNAHFAPSFEFNQVSIREISGKLENSIAILKTIAKALENESVTIANTISDFYAPTLDSSFDKVYALILVGTEPEIIRNDMELIRAFIDLATARKITAKDDVTNFERNEDSSSTITHCSKKSYFDFEKPVCDEALKFIFIHFDSFCGDGNLCDSKLCPVNIFNESIRRRKDPVCNREDPLGDCWCASPRTQILEFDESKDPKRVEIPRLPTQPNITNVVVGNVNRNGKEQNVTLEMESDSDKIIRWKVVLEYATQYEDDRKDIQIKNHQQVYHTTSNEKNKIVLDSLHAGQQYRVRVSSINSIGESRLSLESQFVIGSRLMDVSIQSLEDYSIISSSKSTEEPLFLQTEIPLKLHLALSTPSISPISYITFHNSIGKEVFTCQFIEGRSRDGATCVIEKDEFSVKKKQTMELRVLDESHSLLSTREIEIRD